MKKIIAIDPDVNFSGLAVLNKEDKTIECYSKDFPTLLDFLQTFIGEKDVHIIIEKCWHTTHNWHLNKKDSITTANAKGARLGAVQETGKKIVEMCKHYNLSIEEVAPLRKVWGATGREKISHKEISRFIPIENSRTNQEQRDALLLAWVYVGFPIKKMSKL